MKRPWKYLYRVADPAGQKINMPLTRPGGRDAVGEAKFVASLCGVAA